MQVELLDRAGREDLRGFSPAQCTLAMSRRVKREPCEGGRQGSGKGVSAGPATGKTSSEPNEIGRRSLSLTGGSCHLRLCSSMENTICPPGTSALGPSLVTEASTLGIDPKGPGKLPPHQMCSREGPVRRKGSLLHRPPLASKGWRGRQARALLPPLLLQTSSSSFPLLKSSRA